MSLTGTYRLRWILLVLLFTHFSILMGCREASQETPKKPDVETIPQSVDTVVSIEEEVQNIEPQMEQEPEAVSTEEIIPETIIQVLDSVNLSDSLSDTIEVTLLDSMDSLSISDSVAEDLSSIETVEIIREELMATYQVLFYTDTTANSAVDSILSKESDIEITSERFVTVEFWEHPLYSSQFTMNGKVLRLYGLNPDSNVAFVQHESNQYLSYKDNYYLIENSFSLRPLSAEVDSFIIQQLQIH